LYRYTASVAHCPRWLNVDIEGSPFWIHSEKPATKLNSLKGRSPVIDTPAKTRKKADELIKEAAAAIERAEQTAKQAASYFSN